MHNPFAWMFPGRQRRRRDFSRPAETSKNPLYEQPRRRHVPWLAIIALLALLGGGTYILIHPRFRISEVRVSGTQKLDAGSIRGFVEDRLNATTLGIAWRRVVWLVPTEDISEQIRAAASRLIPLSSINLERQGTVLNVVVSEQVPDVLWERADGSRFYINAAGIIVEAVPATLIDELVTIRDGNRLGSEIGTRVVHPSVLSALKIARERMVSLGLAVTGFSTWPVSCPSVIVDEPDSPANTNASSNANRSRTLQNTNAQPCDARDLAINEPSFTALTEEGWELRLTGASDINAQFGKLEVALRERLGSRDGLEYVDVRFGDRVFFR